MLAPSLRRPLTVLATLVAISALAGCGGDNTTAKDETSPSSSPTVVGPACSYTADGASSDVELPPDHANVAGKVDLTIATNAGDIGATLDADKTPCTVNSFVSLAQQGYFDGTICHRLTTQGIFVLQCGDPTGSGMGGPGYSFKDELDGTEKYGPGTLAMANAGPNTNGSQFFIVYGNSPLPASYTVFGSIDAAGLTVVKDIAAKGTSDGGPDGAPKDEVDITSVTVG
ncbi:peptidylprolyl isomerase [Nocardioides sp.]|uniref:peptidylprolyl isomerase n=1 Tax=Nocardioides sp. TaxID=35761 RepID=UPI0031FF0A02|nr:peptidylprolyl isomerase [Nocardioides sp.]